MSFHDDFLNFIRRKYPFLSPVFPDAQNLVNFVSPSVVKLPRSVLAEIENFVRFIWRETGVHSVFASVDAYMTPAGPRVLEINTNAGGAPLVHMLSEFHGLSQQPFFDAIRAMFENELRLAKKTVPPKSVAIVDDDPQSQKTYFEFQIFKNLFESWSWPTQIADPRDFESAELVYNRYCDFLLAEPKAAKLKAAYESGKTCLTPNPKDYLALADKTRLIELSKISALVPDTILVRSEDAETLWANRKKLFFKPTRSYGSKAVYKGERISKKVFEHILGHDYIAQEYISPETFQGLKFDVRFYFYGNKIQLVGARLFQGQAMNFQLPGVGGFAAVSFE